MVHANPDNPPYSLCCLLEDLAKRPDTSVESSSHCHSSIADPIGGLADFLPASALAGAGGGKNLRIRIIWKESKRIIKGRQQKAPHESDFQWERSPRCLWAPA